MTDHQWMPSIFDLFLDAVVQRPERISWARPAIALPIFIDVAAALDTMGYTTTTGTVRGLAYLTARRLDGDT